MQIVMRIKCDTVGIITLRSACHNAYLTVGIQQMLFPFFVSLALLCFFLCK